MARKPPPRKRGRQAADEARAKRKGCMFCRAKVTEVDYKRYMTLRVIVSEKGKIKSRRTTGLCRRHQNQAGTAVKRAREVALMPFVSA
jgi:small subunit ribosomal protein S18